MVQELRLEGGRAVLAARNPGPGPRRLCFPTAQAFEARVLAGGRELWRWSAGRAFAQVVTELELGPGEERRWTFDLPELPPGTYVVEAWLAAGGAAGSPARAVLARP